MPTPADPDRHQPPEHRRSAGILRYYRGVQGTLLTHIRNRPVFGFGQHGSENPTGPATEDRVALAVGGLDDMDEAIRSGIVGFRLPGLTGPGMLALGLRAGEGTGVDIVATAALALAKSMARGGLATTVLTDGNGGLYLIAFGIGTARPQEPASRYASALALLAPEIATTDVHDFAGRALIESPAHDGFGVPAPYSLVPIGENLGVVVPLTLDEVAAASAGMPLDIAADEVAGRIVGYGDLAAALSEATARSA